MALDLAGEQRRVFLDAVERLRALADPGLVAGVLRSSTIPDAAIRIADALGGSASWVSAQLVEAEGTMLGVAVAAGEHTAAVMADLFGVSGQDMGAFEARAEAAVNHAFAGQAAHLQEGTLEAVDDAVRSGSAAGLGPEEVARRVRDVLGLDAERGRALLAYGDELRAGGMPEGEVDRLVEQERRTKLDARAVAWASTVNLVAAARGQLELWREQEAEGLIAGDFEGEFDDGAGEEGSEGSPFAVASTLFGPPAHPHCLCGVVLEFLDGVFVRVWVRAAESLPCDICDYYAGQLV